MQVEQHIKNLAVIRRKVGKTNTPRDHEKIGKEVTEAIKKLGCNPDKIFYTINGNVTPNLSIKKAVRTRVGTKKIGEGEYGEIFYGCVDKRCKNEIAIKIQKESMTTEYKIGKLLSKLGGVNPYALEKCKDRNVMYSEYANGGALEPYIMKNKNVLRPIHFRFIITDVLYNLYRIHKKYPSFRHSDLHGKNILLRTRTPTLNVSKYKIGKMTLDVEDIGLQTMLTDYGLSSTSTIKNPTIRGLDKHYGIAPTSHMMYDAHLFLNAMFLICARIRTESSNSVIRFIQRILPKEYIGLESNKIENFRLKLNTDHTKLPTFEDIFSDAFFLPYRSKVTSRKNPLNFIPTAKPISQMKPKKKVVVKTPLNQEAAKKRAKAILKKKSMPSPKVTIAPKGYTRIDGKKCTTYKKSEIVEKAKRAGIDTQGKTVKQMCDALKIKYVK